MFCGYSISVACNRNKRITANNLCVSCGMEQKRNGKVYFGNYFGNFCFTYQKSVSCFRIEKYGIWNVLPKELNGITDFRL